MEADAGGMKSPIENEVTRSGTIWYSRILIHREQ